MSSSQVVILGGGNIGSFVAKELADVNYSVTILDSSSERLEVCKSLVPNSSISTFDATNLEDYKSKMSNATLVVNALPGPIGHSALQNIVNLGISCVDVSFTFEDPRIFNNKAKSRGSLVVSDTGIAPGISNIFAAELASKHNIQSLEIFVGGLPFRRTPPWEYAATFSPIDVIAEYIRPARIKINNIIKSRPALSDLRQLEIDKIGTLEAFLTDGLRSLLDLQIPNMKEYTLRYPGYAEKILMLKDSNLFSDEIIQIDGVSMTRLELTSLELFRQWKLIPGEPEFTHLIISSIDIHGNTKGWKVHDEGADGWSSMSRTTGLSTVSFCKMLLDKTIQGTGVFMPEYFGTNSSIIGRIIEDFKAKGISISRF